MSVIRAQGRLVEGSQVSAGAAGIGLELGAHRSRLRPPYLTLAAVIPTLAAPLLGTLDETLDWYLLGVLVLLAWARHRVREAVPAGIQLLSLSFLLGAVPILWTGEARDLIIPLTYAAFFYVVGGCGYEPANRDGRWVWVAHLVAGLTLAHALGVVARHDLATTSGDRTGWNSVGLLAASSGTVSVVGLPGPLGIALLAASSFLVLGSGSRDALAGLVLGLGVQLLYAPKRTQVLIGLLCVVVAVVGIQIAAPDLLSQYLPQQRVTRGFTFQETHREVAWNYWLEECLAHPWGMGFQLKEQVEVSGHNGWLELWARGGLLCAGVFLMGQVVVLSALWRRRKAGPQESMALGLFLSSIVRMAFEIFPFGCTHGMGVFPIVHCTGVALARGNGQAAPAESQPASAPQAESFRTWSRGF